VLRERSEGRQGLLLMETQTAVAALAALAHPGRLEVFRLLVQAGADGMAAGDIARATGSLANTLSTNLSILAGAGLVASRRDGRSIIYTAGYDRMRELLAFLVEDCCAGKPEICAPLTAIASRTCGAEARTC
jgi:DNA-binding transcriptional ArsR family regulator